MSVTYKVTPRIGLNHRKGPGTRYGKTGPAIPCGRTVTGDGKTSGGWVHIQWNGKWGWSYGSYLRKISESRPSITKIASKPKKKNTSTKKNNNDAAKKRAAAAAAAKARALAKQQAEERSRAQRAGKLASFGPVLVFEVNDRKVLPAKNWKRTQNGRWATHEILGKVPRSEFLGPDIGETTFTVTLSAEHGVSPRAMIAKIERLIRNGNAEYLVLGGKIYGWGHKWVLTGASESWNRIYNKGELVQASLDLTFKEYC